MRLRVILFTFFLSFIILACNKNISLEHKTYESDGWVRPWHYLYYKIKYRNVHFSMAGLDIKSDSTFTFYSCSKRFGGKYSINNDIISLHPDTLINEFYPTTFINTKNNLIGKSTPNDDTFIWILEK